MTLFNFESLLYINSIVANLANYLVILISANIRYLIILSDLGTTYEKTQPLLLRLFLFLRNVTEIQTKEATVISCRYLPPI